MQPSNRTLAISLALALAAAPAVAKDSDAPVVDGEIGKALDAAVRKAGGADFWGSVLVAREGKVLLAQGYGFADYAKQPNTPRTFFELASASKQVTAAAILHLEQQNKLSVTDTLDRFFDDVPQDKRGIQVHHLLTHTSGISPECGVPYASTIPRKGYVETILRDPLVSQPGSAFAYSNAGYALLAAVVEEVTKKPFEEYAEKALFKPAQMADTGFIGDRDLDAKRCSVRRSDEPGTFTAAKWHWGWGYRGMGGVVTTVLDLHRWDRALRTDAVLGAAAREKLYTPFRDGYAYGWKVDPTERGTRKAHHSGSVRGYGTNLVRYLEDDAEIFVLSNDPKAAYEVTSAIEALLFAPVALETVVDATPYELGPHRNASIPATAAWEAERKGGHLVLRLRDGKHVAVEVRAPAGYEKKLVAELEQAIATREADDPGGPAATEAGIYLGRYDPAARRVEVTEGLALVVQPEYRGRDAAGAEVVDRRVLLYLEDRPRGQWPFMAKMNVAAARRLVEVLRTVK